MKLSIDADLVLAAVDIMAEAGTMLIVVNGVCVGVYTGPKPRLPTSDPDLNPTSRKLVNAAFRGIADEPVAPVVKGPVGRPPKINPHTGKPLAESAGATRKREFRTKMVAAYPPDAILAQLEKEKKPILAFTLATNMGIPRGNKDGRAVVASGLRKLIEDKRVYVMGMEGGYYLYQAASKLPPGTEPPVFEARAPRRFPSRQEAVTPSVETAETDELAEAAE